jgi:two-component sensor histidine kinase/PAS domain-containing protein
VPPPEYTFDEKRLAALAAYGILDTPAEAGFDDIVLLASQICGTPVALVSLVAADRQWFKARIGFEPCETDLDSSVCAHALVEPDLLVIPDLQQDPRTEANPLVTGAPFIRFYAGAPLRAPSGEVLGSLCVIDGEPRPEGLTEQQASGLRNLARQVMSQLELRRVVASRDAAIVQQHALERRRRDSEEQYRILFEAIDDGFCIIELKFDGGRATDYRFIEINPAFAGQTGLHDATGKWMRDLAPFHEQHWFDAYGWVALTGEPARFEHFAGELGGRWYDVHAFRVGAPAARRVAVLFRDTTDHKAGEELKQRAAETQRLLNEELSHRMKNMFAMVQAIAGQTLRGAGDRDGVDAFSQRLNALSRAHEVLLRQSWSAAELSELVGAVVASVSSADRFDISGPVVRLGPRVSLSASLLLHELATNALKYGALSTGAGRVAVSWRLEGPGDEEELVLDWRERGGPAAITPARRGFGTRLIRMGLTGTGGVELRFTARGLEAEFKAPLAQVQ